MICPQCKCEYIRGVTQCADCGVTLVDQLEESGEDARKDAPIVAIWQGNDPVECDRVKEAFENAGLQFTESDSGNYFGYLPTDPRTEIWISEADRDRARKILSDLLGRVDLDELSPEERESLALPESDYVDTDEGMPSGPPHELPETWYEDNPVAEVWNGDSEELANNLIVCLRELGIASHKLSEAGRWRLVVLPEQQSRAREIVREVVEASPPE